MVRSGLLLQAAYGVIIQDLTVFCCYRSLDKESLDRGTNVIESLLSSVEVHYMLSSLKTLVLHKTNEGENRKATVEDCGTRSYKVMSTLLTVIIYKMGEKVGHGAI